MEEENKSESLSINKVTITTSYLKTINPFLRLHHTVVVPSSKSPTPKASVLIFHSFFEDSSNYLPLAAHLASEGYFECHLLDFRGFGYSTGLRTYADLVELQNDIVLLLQELHKQNASRHISLPTFIISTSYASNVVAGFLINNPNLPLAGVIMCSPAFSGNYQASRLSFIERITAYLVAPLVHVIFTYK